MVACRHGLSEQHNLHSCALSKLILECLHHLRNPLIKCLQFLNAFCFTIFLLELSNREHNKVRGLVNSLGAVQHLSGLQEGLNLLAGTIKRLCRSHSRHHGLVRPSSHYQAVGKLCAKDVREASATIRQRVGELNVSSVSGQRPFARLLESYSRGLCEARAQVGKVCCAGEVSKANILDGKDHTRSRSRKKVASEGDRAVQRHVKTQEASSHGGYVLKRGR
mmetsp:Transcript_16924/g.33036  ORF Transcript_16924/g.33036 Transcript_16924/m.33036 type:complete len:221 (-) Transcript_16924:287-949(-)